MGEKGNWKRRMAVSISTGRRPRKLGSQHVGTTQTRNNVIKAGTTIAPTSSRLKPRRSRFVHVRARDKKLIVGRSKKCRCNKDRTSAETLTSLPQT
jgi:hypothetical protein